ncbi:GAF domain-containing sensor histidine kinase [Undibacterium sp. TC4M20W]|uniref:GAF domain-containing sensor histidine kinase n=1 Tax=unclassified Undibacterium TaxID=2630295 RepID=UPI003BF3CE7F
MPYEKSTDVAMIQSMDSVSTILEAVAATTGLRFVCIARVTADSWTTCAVLDQLEFGLKVGDGLDVTTTLCEEVRDTGKAVIIDSVKDDLKYSDHHTPRIYGFQSYISIPVFRPNGDYFGTLCGLDPLPAKLSTAGIVKSMTLFAQLLSSQMDSEEALRDARKNLVHERETSELREQFIAVLGHDLRNPLGSILTGTDVLLLQGATTQTKTVIERMRRSALRISSLVDDVMDFARGRMGGGISLNMRENTELSQVFQQVVDELSSLYPYRKITADITPHLRMSCDAGRLSQLLSNLLKNALVHGAPDTPVHVQVQLNEGMLEVSVTNAGQAIPPDVLLQLFKPFWRSSPAMGNDGLGLGLYIVAEIARSHGGTVDAQSNTTATTFTFRVMGAEVAM